MDTFSVTLSKFITMNFLLQVGQTMIFNDYYLTDILSVPEIKDLIWVMCFQSPYVYLFRELTVSVV